MILRSEIKNKYSQIPNTVIRDKILMDSAYRLLIYLYSLPDGWKINQDWLGKELGCSRININKKIRQIKEKGYLLIHKSKTDEADYIYELVEPNVSVSDVSVSDVSLADVSLSDVSVSDTYINTNISNTELINTELIKQEEDNKEKNIFEIVEENFGRTLAPFEYQKIREWEDNELTKHAIKEAILNGACSIKYIEAILDSYRINNIKSIQQAIEFSKKFKEQKQKPKYQSQREKENESIARLKEQLQKEGEI